MNVKALSLAATCALTSACTTIVFDNGASAPTGMSAIEQRHHGGGIFELVEFSSPKNLESICGGKNWRSITTEMTFLDGLIRQIVPAGIYSPRTTYIQCASEELPAGKTYGVSDDLNAASQTGTDTLTPLGGPRTEDSGPSSGDSSGGSETVGCNAKHRHLFFDCD